jgi:hypothetical protein
VPQDFLPPDPYADQPPPQPAGQPRFLPPTDATPSPTGPGPAKRKSGRATTALAFGAGSLGLLAFSAGMLFFLTIPASIAGWILGHQAKRRDSGREQANVAVIMGIVGLVLGVIAAAVWIVLYATGDISDKSDNGTPDTNGVQFNVVALLARLL